MGRIRTALATTVVGFTLATQTAAAESPQQPETPPAVGTAGAALGPSGPSGATGPTAGTDPTGSTGPTGPQGEGQDEQTGSEFSPQVIQADPIEAPPRPDQNQPRPQRPQSQPDGSAPESEGPAGGTAPSLTAPVPGSVVPAPPTMLDLSPVPSVVCTDAPGAPRGLLPIYQQASDAYGLGPKGPGILASINLIETRFGELNEVTSSAGAQGWMQFMPGTWDAYGVDADGDGEASPYNPRDAIFSAANYLSASGAPGDWYNAIFAYNRADWYVAEVLAKAGCYGSLQGGIFSLVPKMPELSCEPARPRFHRIPGGYLSAIEDAAGRFDLGRRGVWALASIARLESDFGRRMTGKQFKRRGPFGIDPANWQQYGVDGDGDGVIKRTSPGDSAATLARSIWAAGDIRAGVFNHNQAAWYVSSVLNQADALSGTCEIKRVSWPISLPDASGPQAIDWDNLELTRDSQRLDILSGALDPRVVNLLALITQNHRVMITSLRSDHSMMTASGNVSNHYHGRAIDIAMVDGVSCTDTSFDSPCSNLGRMLTLLPTAQRPTELIYCHDLDGAAGPAFAMADHCGHIHAGFHGY